MRTIATLAAALLCVTAGCLGGIGPGASDGGADGTAPSENGTDGTTTAGTTATATGTTATGGTTTAAGTRTTAAGTTTVTGTTSADGQSGNDCSVTAPDALPGVDGDRIADLAALREAHRRSLANVPGLVVVERETQRVDPGDADWNRTERVRVGDDRWVERSRYRDVAGNGTATVGYRSTLYVDGEGGLFRDWSDERGSFEYRRFGADYFEGPPVEVDPGRLRRHFLGGNYTLAGTRTRDGTRLYLFTAEDLREDADLPVSDEGYEARILVTECGRIREAAVSAVGTNETADIRLRATYEYHLRRVGEVSVDRPEWVAEYRAGDDPGGTGNATTTDGADGLIPTHAPDRMPTGDPGRIRIGDLERAPAGDAGGSWSDAARTVRPAGWQAFTPSRTNGGTRWSR